MNLYNVPVKSERPTVSKETETTLSLVTLTVRLRKPHPQDINANTVLTPTFYSLLFILMLLLVYQA